MEMPGLFCCRRGGYGIWHVCEALIRAHLSRTCRLVKVFAMVWRRRCKDLEVVQYKQSRLRQRLSQLGHMLVILIRLNHHMTALVENKNHLGIPF